MIRPGDCIESVASEVGCTWEELWSHPRNARLREVRPNPNLLLPGDVVHIPVAPEPAGQPLTPGQRHRFRGAQPRTELRVRFIRREAGGEVVVANAPYTLRVDGVDTSGTTTADGFAEARIPSRARRASIELHPDTEHAHLVDVDIGHLDPVEAETGVLQRLQNLGFLRGVPTSQALAGALEAFQLAHDLEPSGTLTPETSARLREVHDG